MCGNPFTKITTHLYMKIVSYDNWNVTSNLFTHYLKDSLHCRDGIAADVHHSANEYAKEQGNVNLLGDKSQHYGDNCGHKCPKCTYHIFSLLNVYINFLR